MRSVVWFSGNSVVRTVQLLLKQRGYAIKVALPHLQDRPPDGDELGKGDATLLRLSRDDLGTC